MKKSLIFMFAMAAIWLYVAVSMRSPAKLTFGEPSEAMQAAYLQSRVGAVRDHGFLVIVDGKEISADDCYVSDTMHLMMPVRQCVELFDCTVTFVDASNACINDNVLADVLSIDGERTAEHTFADLSEAAEAMGISVFWDDENYCFEIASMQADDLPSAYDLREKRMLGGVDDQGTWGTCWAFASMAALETSVTVDGEDFSPEHMTMNSGFDISPNAGGDTLMALAYLLSWKGPVYEWDDPYGDGITDETLEAVRHVQGAEILTDGDRDKVKRMIMAYGGVESSLYMSISTAGEMSQDYNPYTASYYYNGDMQPNHDIVIVGWDDDYSSENFNREPINDGAFICRNSWGEEFGEDGYFYVSYADANLGNYNVAYTKIEETDNYDHNYQTDQLGWIGSMGFSGPEAWFANVYEADSAQQIRAVGFYAVEADTIFDIYLIKGAAPEVRLSDAVYVGSGQAEARGYYTVTLPEGFDVEASERFAAVIDIRSQDTTRPVAIEYAAGEFSGTADITDGEGYISYDGEHWASTEKDYKCNVCLKVYTEENHE